ncbi:MAG: hypothetical protein JJV97_03750 [SAR324 cluster bacterium]|nr:hypothetical protein [SAR324 cluster bacterium]
MLSDYIINYYYQALVLLFITDRFSKFIVSLGRFDRRLNFLFLLLLNLPLALILYQKSLWLAGIFVLAFWVISLVVNYITFLRVSYFLGSIFVLGFLFLLLYPGVFTLLAGEEVSIIKSCFICYLAANIGYFYRHISTERQYSAHQARFNIKKTVAFFLGGVSVCIVMAEFLGFFSAPIPPNYLNSFGSLCSGVFAINIALELILKIGLFKGVFGMLKINNFGIKMFLIIIISGLLMFSLSGQIEYLILGAVIGFFTTLLYRFSDLQMAIIFRLMVTIIPLVALNITI